jgi:ketosteroid isomerase-like protein
MMTQTSHAALDVVTRFHRAWTSGDLDTAMSQLADDFVCHTPGDGSLGKQAYREYLAGFIPVMTGVVDLAQFADGDHVALFYYPQTAVTDKTLAAEYFTVRDGRVAESALAFDRLSYGPPG